MSKDQLNYLAGIAYQQYTEEIAEYLRQRHKPVPQQLTYQELPEDAQHVWRTVATATIAAMTRTATELINSQEYLKHLYERTQVPPHKATLEEHTMAMIPYQLRDMARKLLEEDKRNKLRNKKPQGS